MKSIADSVSKSDFEKLKSKLQAEKRMGVRVVTGSMEPVIRVDDELTIEEIKGPQECLKLFDIIVYWNGSKFICHYVWSVNRNTHSKGERWVVTRSLISAREDFPVLESDILGRVTDRQIPFMRKLWIVLRAKLAR